MAFTDSAEVDEQDQHALNPRSRAVREGAAGTAIYSDIYAMDLNDAYASRA